MLFIFPIEPSLRQLILPHFLVKIWHMIVQCTCSYGYVLLEMRCMHGTVIIHYFLFNEKSKVCVCLGWKERIRLSQGEWIWLSWIKSGRLNLTWWYQREWIRPIYDMSGRMNLTRDKSTWGSERVNLAIKYKNELNLAKQTICNTLIIPYYT